MHKKEVIPFDHCIERVYSRMSLLQRALAARFRPVCKIFYWWKILFWNWESLCIVGCSFLEEVYVIEMLESHIKLVHELLNHIFWKCQPFPAIPHVAAVHAALHHSVDYTYVDTYYYSWVPSAEITMFPQVYSYIATSCETSRSDPFLVCQFWYSTIIWSGSVALGC